MEATYPRKAAEKYIQNAGGPSREQRTNWNDAATVFCDGLLSNSAHIMDTSLQHCDTATAPYNTFIIVTGGVSI